MFIPCTITLSHDSVDMAKLGWLFSLLWIIVLIFIAWPIAGLVAGVYILLLPFGACIKAIKEVNDFLYKIISWPYNVGKYIVNGKSCSDL